MTENSTIFANTTDLDEPDLDKVVAIMKNNLDSFFIIIMGIVVFLMQCGFAFLEAGAVR